MIQMYMMVMRDLPPDSKQFMKLNAILRVNQDFDLRFLYALFSKSITKYLFDDNDALSDVIDGAPAHINPSQCKTKFRFLKHDLIRLMKALKIPEEIKMRNRSWQSGEEVLLRGLYELVHACN
ncbi:hypothetical protein B484DRAFT_397618 [Ochromonadaceae sp. CCMP2298]|nr:hypothetical protein B484DRAFT_397618 [Ochromonadaceae sp. CCMP2298]